MIGYKYDLHRSAKLQAFSMVSQQNEFDSVTCACRRDQPPLSAVTSYGGELFCRLCSAGAVGSARETCGISILLSNLLKLIIYYPESSRVTVIETSSELTEQFQGHMSGEGLNYRVPSQFKHVFTPVSATLWRSYYLLRSSK